MVAPFSVEEGSLNGNREGERRVLRAQTDSSSFVGTRGRAKFKKEVEDEIITEVGGLIFD